MKYVLLEFLLNLLNIHWWIWISLCMFVAVKNAGDEEDEQVGKYLAGFIFGGGGIYLFERYVGSAQSFRVADFLTIAAMTWLLGMIIKGQKSKTQTPQNTVATPLLEVSDGMAIMCQECLRIKLPKFFDDPSSEVCIECQQQSDVKQPSTSANPQSSIREQLRELKNLLDDDLINEADYDKKKSELLDKM